jgi:hypothetical protein
MYNLIPEVKSISEKGRKKHHFSAVLFDPAGLSALDGGPGPLELGALVQAKLWNLPFLRWSCLNGRKEAAETSAGAAEETASTGAGAGGTVTRRAVVPSDAALRVEFHRGFAGGSVPEELDADKLCACGYSIELSGGRCLIGYSCPESVSNALSTLKQLLVRDGEGYSVGSVSVYDYPAVATRSLSTTFAWYAGYGRIGFDSQLWSLGEWKQFLNICSDFKINQLNMCMYGYWPFEFPEYPETCLRNIPMKVWNRESRNALEILYTHPNLTSEFLPGLIQYAHLLSIRVFAYIGLNSYNGGYSNIHRDKRMKLPRGSRYVNDFDSLCLSDSENIAYLQKAMARVVGLGLDGIVFEESEEAYWFCTCEACTEAYGSRTTTPAEAKHEANYELLRKLHAVIKRENPACEVGLRAWREPPLEKSVQYLEHCRDSIPPDVCLYWAPGLYVPEAEFSKWVRVFGAERICARDTESNAWSSTQGRLIRIFKSNVLRSGEETNDQFIEKDIEQHRGSVAHGVRGINGYLFEWYGYFLHLLAHAHYGWGSREDEEGFYDRAVRRLLGDEVADDVLYVLRNILTIHESQVRLFPAEFPFLRNNVSRDDVPAIREAQARWPDIDRRLAAIIAYCESSREHGVYAQHFRKIRNAHQRNRHIYALCLAAIRYDNEPSEARRLEILEEIREHNERDFEQVKSMFFDIYPVDRTGVKSCMYPYHELKRVLDNALGRNRPPDEEMVYLGVEALGWLWI